jgi:hypothetical protein
MDQQRVTSVDSQRLPPAARGFNGPGFFAHKDRLARLCILVTLASIVCSILTHIELLTAMQRDTRVMVLDGAGNVYIGAARAFADSKELLTQQAYQAAQALLLRNPRDFDEPELLKLFFSTEGLVQAAALKAAEARAFDEMQFQQKPQIKRLDIRQSRPGEFQAHITGDALRDGIFQGKTFRDVVPFSLDLVLRRNPDLLHNRLQPTLVAAFTLNYETAHN